MGFASSVDNMLGGMINHCNEAINKIGGARVGKKSFIGDLYGNIQLQKMAKENGNAHLAEAALVGGQGVRMKNQIGSGYMRGVANTFRKADGSLNYGRTAGAVAGTYMGLSTVGRIASGGGLYRDSGGNFDLIGVPFI